jgi:hypothetical protein
VPGPLKGTNILPTSFLGFLLSKNTLGLYSWSLKGDLELSSPKETGKGYFLARLTTIINLVHRKYRGRRKAGGRSQAFCLVESMTVLFLPIYFSSCSWKE